MKRRSVLKALSVTSVASVTGVSVTGCGSSSDPGAAAPIEEIKLPEELLVPQITFDHGVASGDPLPDAVILWSRVTPVDTTFDGDIPVNVFVAKDENCQEIVSVNEVITNSDRDYTVKFDATGLESDTWYYYFFSVGNVVSPMGRTRTFAASDKEVNRARFALASCSNWQYGNFSVYTAIANHADLDFVLHLGDYLYEYEAGGYADPASVPDRVHEPANEMISLSDYRVRHGQYKTDVDLQRVHQQYPMICIWDDHEFTNDAYKEGAENHTEGAEGVWEQRSADAIQAYFEWMPLRAHPQDSQRIYRKFSFGDLFDLFMMDTRFEGRDEQVADLTSNDVNDPERQLISDDQMSWLRDGLKNSTAQWKMMGQQVMFGQLNIAELPNAAVIDQQTIRQGLNTDQWDGYTAERTKVMNTIQGFSGNSEPSSSADRDHAPVDNVVIFTGDIHTSWANEIYRNPATLVGDLFDAPMAAEFVVPSVTSPGFPEGAAEAVSLALAANSHMKYTELKSRGFVLMDVNRERAQAEYYYVESISDDSVKGQLVDNKTKVVAVNDGDSRIVEDGRISTPRSIQVAMCNPKVESPVVESAAVQMNNDWYKIRGFS